MLSLLDSSWFCEIDWLISVKIFLGAQRNELFLTNWCFAHFLTVTARCFFPMSHWQGRAKKTPGATEPINNNPRHSSCAVHPSASKNTTKIYSLKKIVFYIKETFVSLFFRCHDGCDEAKRGQIHHVANRPPCSCAVQLSHIGFDERWIVFSIRSDQI